MTPPLLVRASWRVGLLVQGFKTQWSHKLSRREVEFIPFKSVRINKVDWQNMPLNIFFIKP
jgi:hypothetical protein